MKPAAAPPAAVGGNRGGDVAIGALAALIYLGEYLGQGAIANQAFNTGSVTALATAAFATLLAVALSARRNPMAGPRFLSVVWYATVLEYMLTVPALKPGGALLAFAMTSLCVSLSGVWLMVVCHRGWESCVRAVMSLPSLSALGFIVATTTIVGQLQGIGRCGGAIGWPALAVMATVVGVAFAMKYGLRAGSVAHRARLCVALVCASLVYFGWRALAPTPALCGPIGQIDGAGLADALMGAWRWPARMGPGLAHAQVLLAVLVGSGVMAVLCLVDTVSAASTLASDEGRPDADTGRELWATAVGNLAGGLLGLLPISLSLARSRTVAQLHPASGRLPALAHAAVLVVLIVLLVPLQLPLLDYLPRAAVAGALVVASIEMIDDKSALLWRAGLGARHARRTLAGGVWVFACALAVAMGLAVGPQAKYAVSAGFAVAIAGSLLGLLAAGRAAAAIPSGGPFAGRLHFLNIGRRLRVWKLGASGIIDLSHTTHVDFSAACALADLARGLESEGVPNPFRLGAGTGPQVRQMLEVCHPRALEPGAPA